MRMIRVSLPSSVLMIASQFSDLSAAIEKQENSRNLAKMHGIRERIVYKDCPSRYKDCPSHYFQLNTFSVFISRYFYHISGR